MEYGRFQMHEFLFLSAIQTEWSVSLKHAAVRLMRKIVKHEY